MEIVLQPPGKVIAVLAANPALSSLLTMVLAGDSRLRVREFESEIALRAYIRIAPVDMLVCDFDRADLDLAGFIASLRTDPATVDPHFRAIALTRAITPSMRHEIVACGIDEVIVKPMSPRHLLQRVTARLRDDRPHIAVPGYRGPERRNRVPPAAGPAPRRRLADNVIELFPNTYAAPPAP